VPVSFGATVVAANSFSGRCREAMSYLRREMAEIFYARNIKG